MYYQSPEPPMEGARAVNRFRLAGLEAVVWEYPRPSSDHWEHRDAVTLTRTDFSIDGLPSHVLTMDDLPAAERLLRWAFDELAEYHSGGP